jgi:opacity protein-like surface antigen
MKRFLMLVGVAVVAAAMYVAASPASQQAKGPTARQFKALKNQVTALGHTVKGLKTVVAAEGKLLTDCVKIAVPINQFGDPDGSLSGTAQGYDYGKGTWPGTIGPTTGFFTTGIDVTATTDTGALWVVGGTSTCGTDLGESALRHAAAKAGIRLPHASTRAPSFVAHGR